MEINQQEYIKESLTWKQTSCYLFSKRHFKEARERNENTAKNKSDCHIYIRVIWRLAENDSANHPGGSPGPQTIAGPEMIQRTGNELLGKIMKGVDWGILDSGFKIDIFKK